MAIVKRQIEDKSNYKAPTTPATTRITAEEKKVISEFIIQNSKANSKKKKKRSPKLNSVR